MVLKAQLLGVDEIRRKLAGLRKRGIAAALRKGVTAGAKVLNKAVKARVRKGSGVIGGLLRKSIGQKVKVFRGSGVAVAIVGPRKGFLVILASGRRVDPVKYAHIEEYGRTAVRPKRRAALSDRDTIYGRQAVRYTGNPFMRPAMDETRARVAAAAAAAMAAEAEKQARKVR